MSTSAEGNASPTPPSDSEEESAADTLESPVTTEDTDRLPELPRARASFDSQSVDTVFVAQRSAVYASSPLTSSISAPAGDSFEQHNPIVYREVDRAHDYNSASASPAPEQTVHGDESQSQLQRETVHSLGKRKPEDPTNLTAFGSNSVCQTRPPCEQRNNQQLPLPSAGGYPHQYLGLTTPSPACLVPAASSATPKISPGTPIHLVEPPVMDSTIITLPSMERTIVEPNVATSTSSPTLLDSASQALILEDLRPGQLLRGSTVHALIRTFIAPTVLRKAEVRDASSIQETITTFIEHGPSDCCDFVLPLCLNRHWVGIVYRENRNTIQLIDSSVGCIPENMLNDCLQSVSFSVSNATGHCAPTRIRHETPQQPNSYDCGIYLLVCLVRLVAQREFAATEFKENPVPVDGAVLRAILTEVFSPAVDSLATMRRATAADVNSVSIDPALQVRLKSLRTTLSRLQACEVSGKITRGDFAALGQVLHDNESRLEEHVKALKALSTGLAETRPLLVHRRKRARTSEDAYGTVEADVQSSLQKLSLSLAELRSAGVAIRDIASRLQSFISTLSSFRQATRTSIEQLVEEGLLLRNNAKMRILDMAKRMEEEEQLVADLDAVLTSDDVTE